MSLQFTAISALNKLTGLQRSLDGRITQLR
jgi:hypothetical protein